MSNPLAKYLIHRPKHRRGLQALGGSSKTCSSNLTTDSERTPQFYAITKLRNCFKARCSDGSGEHVWQSSLSVSWKYPWHWVNGVNFVRLSGFRVQQNLKAPSIGLFVCSYGHNGETHPFITPKHWTRQEGVLIGEGEQIALTDSPCPLPIRQTYPPSSSPCP